MKKNKKKVSVRIVAITDIVAYNRKIYSKSFFKKYVVGTKELLSKENIRLNRQLGLHKINKGKDANNKYK